MGMGLGHKEQEKQKKLGEEYSCISCSLWL